MKHAIFVLACPSQKLTHASVQLNDVFIDKPKNNLRHTIYWRMENGKYVGINVVAEQYGNLELLRKKLIRHINDTIDFLVIKENQELEKKHETENGKKRKSAELSEKKD